MAENFLTYRGKRWLWIGAVGAGLLIASYIPYSRQMPPHGGTAMGLAYGILGTVLILVLMAVGIRKRQYSSSLGTVQGWTSAHVYLGLLVLLVIPLHAGLKFRPDIHTLAFALLAIVVLSGMVGVALYLVVPARLTKYETAIQADKMDKEINRLLDEMRTLSKDKSDAFVALYRREIQRSTGSGHKGWALLFRDHRSELMSKRAQELAEAVNRIPQQEHADLQVLSRLILQKAQLESNLIAQMRLKNAMSAWLYIHLPISVAMLVAVLVHIVVVFYY